MILSDNFIFMKNQMYDTYHIDIIHNIIMISITLSNNIIELMQK